ncbi:Pyrroline-5-carboxylate reductase, NAD(P)-binding [Magnetospirillum sp. LM-5]|uniref:pyrroline-5-carboxylate reductase n=1 Tax=Magnetospirillum sp. LM-5 TaxID=2681466 RepID=UPI001382DDB7|nr:pyrroline-5-carboxylate reductase [Magnetospirillum sp. LM-5]CAA7614782.1 Pyrroline-5-carboxylate reductase, NAD(P)-binding [Magnetospirillum sp. LM-5]
MTKILLVGCGKMGSAMLAGWLEQGIRPADVVVVEPNPAQVPAGVALVGGADAIPAAFSPDIVILAVKPQVMADVVPAYARFAGQATFLSIAAGKPISFFQTHLGQGAAIVRAMPNTPAAVRRGITVCCAGPGVTDQARSSCQSLLQAVGQVAWIEDEVLMDAVTAVSGSGPAYVFLLAEVMAEAGARAGLPTELAAQLARATIAGAGELLRQSNDSAAQLRINVTSPGGTTAAALSVLMDGAKGMGPLMVDAVAAATRRGKELAG